MDFLFDIFLFKPSLLGASLKLSMKALIRFLAEFHKEMKLPQLPWLSVRLLCLRVREISSLLADPSQV